MHEYIRVQLQLIDWLYTEDHLARAVRRRLKQRKILSGIDVVYSTEKPGEVNLLPLGKWQSWNK
jgi:tRNA A37 threonylcarbamoyladenosine dehydratase